MKIDISKRRLLKSVPAVAAIPLVIANTPLNALPLEPGKKYLFLISDYSMVDIEVMCESLGKLGVEGTLHCVSGHIDDAMRIYEV